jgi:WD40 repeat protein
MPRYRTVLVCAAVLAALAADAAHGQPAATDLSGDALPPGAVARLGTVRFRHANPIVFAAFLPDGKRVLSVSGEGVLRVWEFPSGKQLGHLEKLAGEAGTVTSATLSPDGKHLTAFCGDEFMRVWDWANARQTGKVANLRRAVGGRGLDTGEPVYSPDRSTLLLFGASRVLQLVDLPSGKEVGPRPGHTDPVLALSFTPAGTRVWTQDGTVTRTWDVARGTELGSFTTKLPRANGMPPVIRPDGRIGVAVPYASPAAVARGLIKASEAFLFDTATGKDLATVSVKGEPGAFYGRPVVFSPDGNVLAANAGAAGEQVHLYEVPSGKLLRTLDAGAVAPPPKGIGPLAFPRGRFGGGMQQMLFSPDGKALAFHAGPGAWVVVLDTATGKQLASLPPSENITTLQGAFSPDGRCLALTQNDGTVALYELASRQPRRTYGSKLPLSAADKARADQLAEMVALGGPFGRSRLAMAPRVRIAISPDSRLLALAGPDGSVHVWDVLTGKELALFKGHPVRVNALAFAPDGKTLASAGDDTIALIWDVTRIARPAPAAKALKPGDLEAWWQALAGNDAARAFAAMGDFVAVSQDAVAWIKDHVLPAATLDGKRALELMKRLDDDRFKVRTQATHELLKLGEQLLPVLDKSLAEDTTAETRRRLEGLRDKLASTALQGEALRAVRALEILEIIGTPQARQVLRTLAGGAPGALVTTRAQAALRR